jgi:hypothetical protein
LRHLGQAFYFFENPIFGYYPIPVIPPEGFGNGVKTPFSAAQNGIFILYVDIWGYP